MMKPIFTKHKIFLLGRLFAMVALALVIVLTTGRHNPIPESAKTNAFAENETTGSSMTTSSKMAEGGMHDRLGGGEGQKRLSNYLPFIASVSMLKGKTTAYVCENYVCKLPTADIAVMTSLLE
jgi:uncharacterized protein YyaL (SSP411 family)